MKKALITGAAFARFGLGPGTASPYETDAKLEYRMVPNQQVYRFGNLVTTNERSTRSPTLAGDTRKIVLVVGDSVPYGESETAQAQLATSLLSNHPTLFANLVAKSWGPANEPAALRQNSDPARAAIVIVRNSEDLSAIPTFAPLDADHPANIPILTLGEAATTYLPRYLPARNATPAVASHIASDPAQLAEGRVALDALLADLKSQPEPACVVLHPTLSALKGAMSADNREIAAHVKAQGIPRVAAQDMLRKAITGGKTDSLTTSVSMQKGKSFWPAQSATASLEQTFGPLHCCRDQQETDYDL